MPLYSKWIRRFPSSITSTISPFNKPSPKLILVPFRAFFPGFTRHSHTSFSFLFKRSISINAPVSSLCPYNLAGITFVSLITRQSPGFRYSRISVKWRCSILPSLMDKCINLDALRSVRGSWAISSWGRS